MAKRYGYARVSTDGQEREGYSLEEQEAALKEAGAEEIIIEAYTGTKMERPKFTSLINKLETGDTLIVCKLDRYARDAGDGYTLAKSLIDRGIKFHILNMGLIENTPIGRMILRNMLSYAEFERDMIVERTQAGKRIAKQKPGYREGRPRKYTDEQLALAIDLLKAGNSYGRVSKLTGISKGSIYREAVKAGLVHKDVKLDM